MKIFTILYQHVNEYGMRSSDFGIITHEFADRIHIWGWIDIQLTTGLLIIKKLHVINFTYRYLQGWNWGRIELGKIANSSDNYFQETSTLANAPLVSGEMQKRS